MNSNADFGIQAKIQNQQLELFPEWWEDIIAEKQAKIRRTETEGIRSVEYEPDMIAWIKNPVVRIRSLKKNSDLKYIEVEEVTKAIPNTDPDGPDYYFRSQATTEIVEFENFQIRNKDLESLIRNDYEDVGISHYEPPAFAMDLAHFNEMCTDNGTHILALYEKNHLDWKKDFWLDEEWIMQNLKIEYKDAQRLAYAFERLDLDRKTVAKLMHGYVSDSRIEKISQKKSWKMKDFKENKHMKAGMKQMRGELLADFIDYIEDLADIMPKLKKNDVHSGETKGNIGDPDTLDWVREATRFIQDQVPDEEEYEDRFNYAKDTVFGTHALYYGAEGCSHELLSYINECDRTELNEMKKAMFPQKTAWGGMKRAEYWYLTASQKSQVWRYIKDRQEKLDEEDVIRF